jgi:hypothetical protein
MIEIEINSDISGSPYKDLLAALWPLADSLSLIVHPDMEKGLALDETVQALEPDRIGQHEVSEWPGTILLDGVATCHEFRCTPNALAVAGSRSNSLFSWLQPELPEDPALRRTDGTLLLETVSHESVATLYLTTVEAERLRRILMTLPR